MAPCAEHQCALELSLQTVLVGGVSDVSVLSAASRCLRIHEDNGQYRSHSFCDSFRTLASGQLV
jgi:hypothetical protein